MLVQLGQANMALFSVFGLFIAFGMTCLLTATLSGKLPRDGGRAFAHDGKLSAGKPRGAGIIFILVFVATALLFTPYKNEQLIYLILIVAEMITGFMDDASDHPWGEMKKGVLDLVIAIVVAVTYLNFNPNTIRIAVLGSDVVIPKVLFGILIVVLVWAAVNVTNCADGVDGLSGTLTIITLIAFYAIEKKLWGAQDEQYIILIFISCILGYLWFNATPSRLMMGDAGSRAMGIFISIVALRSKAPLLFVPLAIVLILDGGLGLIKVTCIRLFKLHFMKNLRTPLHDHARKNMGWSNTQTVYRFAIIQVLVAVLFFFLI